MTMGWEGKGVYMRSKKDGSNDGNDDDDDYPREEYLREETEGVNSNHRECTTEWRI